MSRWFLAMTLVLLGGAAPAAAEDAEDAGPALSLGVGLRLNATGAIDLAGLAGASGYGSGDDSSPASLGLAITLGVLVDRFEVMVEGAVNVGGLDLAGVEERYYESDPQPIGGTSTAWLSVAARYLLRLSADVELAAGLGGGYLVMGASSPVGGGFYRAITAGPEAELRYRVHGEAERVGGGWLTLALDGRLLLPTVARVGADPEPVFAMDGVGDANWLAGLGLYYRFDWR